MATNFYYFKFVATEWLTGNIILQPLSVQGLFINICALYWQRDGKLSIDDINSRFRNPKELKPLIGNFITVIRGKVSIKFLDEQLISAKHISKTNSDNGKLGGRPLKSIKTESEINRPVIEIKQSRSKEEIKIEEDTTTEDAIFFKMRMFRPDIPDDVLKKERSDFEVRYPKRTTPRHDKLIQTWANNISYVTPKVKTDEFEKIAAANRLKYGS